jgi:hypothetical protein
MASILDILGVNLGGNALPQQTPGVNQAPLQTQAPIDPIAGLMERLQAAQAATEAAGQPEPLGRRGGLALALAALGDTLLQTNAMKFGGAPPPSAVQQLVARREGRRQERVGLAEQKRRGARQDLQGAERGEARREDIEFAQGLEGEAADEAVREQADAFGIDRNLPLPELRRRIQEQKDAKGMQDVFFQAGVNGADLGGLDLNTPQGIQEAGRRIGERKRAMEEASQKRQRSARTEEKADDIREQVMLTLFGGVLDGTPIPSLEEQLQAIEDPGQRAAAARQTLARLGAMLGSTALTTEQREELRGMISGFQFLLVPGAETSDAPSQARQTSVFGALPAGSAARGADPVADALSGILESIRREGSEPPTVRGRGSF